MGRSCVSTTFGSNMTPKWTCNPGKYKPKTESPKPWIEILFKGFHGPCPVGCKSKVAFTPNHSLQDFAFIFLKVLHCKWKTSLGKRTDRRCQPTSIPIILRGPNSKRQNAPSQKTHLRDSNKRWGYRHGKIIKRTSEHKCNHVNDM